MFKCLQLILAIVFLMCASVHANENLKTEISSAIKGNDVKVLKRHLAANRKLANLSLDEKATTPLILSIRRNRPACGQLLIQAGARLNSKDAFGLSAIHHALLAQNVKIIEWLCGKGADVNQLDGVGRSPLAYAAALPGDSSINAIKVLAKHRLDPDLRANQEVLYHAADGNQTTLVAQLLKLGISPDVDGRFGSPLHVASSPETIAVLLAAGADPNKTSPSGFTPLSCAQNSVAVRLLLKAGAGKTINLPDKHGNTALFYCSSYTIFRLLTEAGADFRRKGKDGQVPLHGICLHNGKDMSESVRVLLTKGESPNVADINGNTPLHYCAIGQQREDVALAKTLLSNGARPDAKNKVGHSALFTAMDRGNLAIAELLEEKVNLSTAEKAMLKLKAAITSGNYKTVRGLVRDHKDLVDSVDSYGKPVLMQRATDPQMVRLLLEAGADANSKDTDGYSALQYAVLGGATESAKILTENGSSLNYAVRRNPYYDRPWVLPGYTALHLAVAADAARPGEKLPFRKRADQVETVKFLFGKGAKWLQAADGNTPLHLVGTKDMLSVLLKHTDKQTINIKNRAGDTPLHLAARRKQYPIAVQLIKAGADTEIRNMGGQFPQDCLQERQRLSAGPTPILHWLLAQRAEGDKSAKNDIIALAGKLDLSRSDSLGNTALHLALELGLIREARILVDAGASLDAVNFDGETPLHVACRYLHSSTVAALIKRGADPQKKNIFDESVLEVALNALAAAQKSGIQKEIRKAQKIEQTIKAAQNGL